MQNTQRNAPVRERERIIALDILRGFAVLGILLANITGFAHQDIAYYWPPGLPGGGSAADEAIWLAQFTLVDAKFRGLFALLFGAGMMLAMDRAANYESAIWLQARRLFWLAIFGLLHFYLLFDGDILFSYAIAGLIAIIALTYEARPLLLVGTGLALLGGLMRSLQYGDVALVELQALLEGGGGETYAYLQEYWRERIGRSAQDAVVFADGSYREVVAQRLGDSFILWHGFTLTFFETIPVMVIGMGLFRAGTFTDADLRRRWRGWAWAAFVLGALLHLAAGASLIWLEFPPFSTQFAFFGLSLIFTVPMLLGGAVLLTDWAMTIRKSWLGERLALAGRVAFTNYVGTSLVMSLIFQGWAGGLFGTMDRLEMLAVVALGWALMLTFSRLWLRRFRFGPLEWLWRCLTYWRLFPIRR